MILVDLNQVIISGLMVQIGNKKASIDENLIRHIALNTIRSFKRKFTADYGDVVICCDNRKYWRKEIFPFYKAGRKKTREKSALDWHLIFDIIGKIKQELKDNMPYKVIDVEGAEADDIIGTLAPRYVAHENVLILSSDGDFVQLQMYNSKDSKYHIKQYSPILKKFLISDNPHLDLKIKIINGDKGDGIPNILSASDCLVKGERQKSVRQQTLDKLLAEDFDKWTDETAKIGFSRNKMLIDLREIPTDVKQRVIGEFDNNKPAPKSKILNYFIEKQLRNLMEVLGEF
jgi:hypothetical protein